MIPDPYIPEQVVDPEDFVGRYEEIEKCKTFLEFSIDSKPRNIAIIGDWGIGKTALLRKFEDIAIQNESPSARFDVRKDMSLLEFEQRLLLELKTALSFHEKLSVKAREFLSGFDVSMGYAGVSVKKMKTQTIDLFARFFNFIELKPFTYEEVKDAIEKPSEYIPNLKFEPETIAEIYRKSEGHPFIVKSMCSTTYIMMKGEGVITKNIVERFMPRILYDLGKKVFSDRFASASPIEQRILIAMASFDGNSLNYSEIAKMSDASKKKVGTFLSRLTEKDLVRKVERGQYELFHPLFKEYIKNFVIGGGNL